MALARTTIEPADVSESWSGSSSGGNRRRASQSRALDLLGWRLTLTHRPTGRKVSGEVPTGHYAKREMQRRKQALRAELTARLEREIA